jgi:hypothetical protein
MACRTGQDRGVLAQTGGQFRVTVFVASACWWAWVAMLKEDVIVAPHEGSDILADATKIWFSGQLVYRTIFDERDRFHTFRFWYTRAFASVKIPSILRFRPSTKPNFAS